MTLESWTRQEILAPERRRTNAKTPEQCFYCGRPFNFRRPSFPYITREGAFVKACFQCIMHQRRLKAPRLGDIATLIRSLTAAGTQKGIVAELIIKQAIPDMPRITVNNDVKRLRNMGAWKN